MLRSGPVSAGPARVPAGLPRPAEGVFTTRSGGTSRQGWASLNLGLHVHDDPERVQVNRRALAREIGASELVFAEQVHGARVAVVAGPPAAGGPVAGVDALVTRTPGLALVALAADCLPVLLADPVAGVVAAAHAGRSGLAAGVLQATVEAMVGLGAQPGRTSAVLGPAICGACYELPGQLADEVGRQVPGSRSSTRQGTPSIDLAAGAERLLRDAGVGTVTRVGGCTSEQPELFYSFRRDGVTGRHAGVVRLLDGPADPAAPQRPA